MTDPYAVLGLKPGASEADIKAAWRRLARQYHPDHNPNNPAAEARFKQIKAAYDLLKAGGFGGGASSSAGTASTGGDALGGTVVNLSVHELARLDEMLRLVGAPVNAYTRGLALRLCVECSHWWIRLLERHPKGRLIYTERGFGGNRYIYRVYEAANSALSDRPYTGGTPVDMNAATSRMAEAVVLMCRYGDRPVTANNRRHAIGLMLDFSSELLTRAARGDTVQVRIPDHDGATVYSAPLWNWFRETLNPKADYWHRLPPYKRTWWRRLLYTCGWLV
jgi:hypothetical protein